MTAVERRDDEARRDLADLLAEQATPEVLRDNPFRVIDLPTDASNWDLRRKAEQTKRDPDVPTADVERVEAAVRRLRDPVQRLFDELLWYWPDDADTDTGHNLAIWALAELVEGDAEDSGRRDATERPNVARDGASDAVGAGAGNAWDLMELCGMAIGTMARALEASATADYVTARARALDDPRVTAAGARRLLEEAQVVVPLVALRMAARAHGAGEAEVASGLAEAVRAYAGPYVARDAAAKVLEPAVGRLRALTEAAERATRDDPARGAERAARLLEQTTADRELVDALLDDADPLRAGVVDRIADQLFDDVISFYNETGDDRTATRLLQQARVLRPSSATQGRIDDNLAVIRENVELRRCWYCKAAPGDPAVGLEIPLYGDVERDYRLGRVTWSTLKVPVPRCHACAAEDREWNRAAGRRALVAQAVSWLLFVLLLFMGYLIFELQLHPTSAIAFLVFLFLIVRYWGDWPGGPRRGGPGGTDEAVSLVDYPPLKEKLASGWQVGLRPPGTS
jgi:hypothetical protein